MHHAGVTTAPRVGVVHVTCQHSRRCVGVSTVNSALVRRELHRVRDFVPDIRGRCGNSGRKMACRTQHGDRQMACHHLRRSGDHFRCPLDPRRIHGPVSPNGTSPESTDVQESRCGLDRSAVLLFAAVGP